MRKLVRVPSEEVGTCTKCASSYLSQYYSYCAPRLQAQLRGYCLLVLLEVDDSEEVVSETLMLFHFYLAVDGVGVDGHWNVEW